MREPGIHGPWGERTRGTDRRRPDHQEAKEAPPHDRLHSDGAMAEQGLPCPVRQSGRAHRRLPSGQPQQRAGAGLCCSEEGLHRVQDRESAPPRMSGS